MDGRGRALDNAFIERLWRTVKSEHVYLHEYATLAELRGGLQTFFQHYNFRRPHQALKYRTPAEIFFQDKKT
jgi:putative transposase